MSKIVLGAVFLLLPIFLNANYVLKNELGLNDGAIAQIKRIGDELKETTNVEAYVYATNADLERGQSAHPFIEQYYDAQKEQIFLFLAPNSMRIHVLTQNDLLNNGVNKNEITSYAIGVISSKDKNSIVDKYNVAVVQAYSEMADQVADLKGVELVNTLPNSTTNTVDFLRWIVYIGSIFVLYGLFIKPYMKKRELRKSKEEELDV
jgi:hypothetical protein